MRLPRLMPPRLMLALTLSGCGTLSYYGPADKSTTGPPTDPTNPTTPGDDDDVVGDDDDNTVLDTETSTTTSTSTTTTTTSTSTTTTTTPPAPFQPEITAVTPDYGSNLGGTLVTVSGSFDVNTDILFNGLPATITRFDPTEIEALTPGTAATGWVDVEAVAGTEGDVLPGAYQYWEDGSGLAGVFGWMSYVDIVGGYWVNPTDVASAAIGFLEPTAWELWSDYTPVMETCSYLYVPSAITVLETGAASVELTGAPNAVALGPSAALGPGMFGDPALGIVNEAVPGTVYDLSPVAGNADWPGFDIPGVVELPPAFNVLTPNLDKVGTLPPLVNQSFTITWDGAGGDYMVLFILRQNQGTYVNDGVVTCAMVDDGSFTVPLGVWPDWQVGDFLHIELGRVYQSSAILPHNNAENRMAGIYWVYGGGEAN